MDKQKPSPRHPPTNYTLVGILTLVIYLTMLWVGRYLPEELAYFRYLIHVILLIGLLLIGVGVRQSAEQKRPPRLSRKPMRTGIRRTPQ